MTIELNRRDFLRLAAFGGISLAVSACKPKILEPTTAPPAEKQTVSPTLKPTEAPTVTASPVPTNTPEATLVPEETTIKGMEITGKYLTTAFGAIGGPDDTLVFNNGQINFSSVDFGKLYVTEAWGMNEVPENLLQDPVGILRYLTALGTYYGYDGYYFPGENFPGLGKLALPRLSIEKVPSETKQTGEDNQNIVPLDFIVHSGAQLTILGQVPQLPSTINDNRPDKEENPYSVVVVTDYLRDSGLTPRHYLVFIPTFGGENSLSLENLLVPNGYKFSSLGDQIIFESENGDKTILDLNTIEGPSLIENLVNASGLAFVDQINGKIIDNPVVPYPEKLPLEWEIQRIDKDGQTIILLRGSDEAGGEKIDLQKAVYNQEKGEWEWVSAIVLEEGEKLIGEDFIALPDERIKQMLEEKPGSFVLPTYVDEKSEVTFEKSLSGGTLIGIRSCPERVMFYPVLQGLSFGILTDPRDPNDIKQFAQFITPEGVIFSVKYNPDVTVLDVNLTNAFFGDQIASDFPVRETPLYGDILIGISTNTDAKERDLTKFILKYKGRIVARQQE